VVAVGGGDVGMAVQAWQADGQAAQRCHHAGRVSGSDQGFVFLVGDVADPVELVLYLSSRVHLWNLKCGVLGELRVDSGDPAACPVAVRAERGEFVGVGVQDLSVWVPAFLPSVDESWLSPCADGAGGDAEFGGQGREEPFVFARCLVRVRGQGCAAVGDRVPGAGRICSTSRWPIGPSSRWGRNPSALTWAAMLAGCWPASASAVTRAARRG
jgi:hypothetical protein